MSAGVEIKGDGWFVFQRDGQWILKFKEGSKWLQHRVPKHVVTEHQVRRYARTFLSANAKEAKAASTLDGPSEIHKGMSFRSLAGLWTTAKLAELYPDHVREKRSHRSDRARLTKHVLPVIGDRALSDFEGEQGLDLCDAVMRSLPPLSRDSRRHVAQILHRLLAMAVFPLRLLSAQPLPRGWLPKGSPAKARSYVYPSEDRQLLACTKIPLLNRLFYGFLAREGLRASEARELLVSDLDLERGLCTLDTNKTDDPRAWVLAPGCRTALERYLERFRPGASSDELLFVDPTGRRPPGDHLAHALRRDLKRALVKRTQLFTDNDERSHIRGHDLRATFVTVHLAVGKTETWVADRTGHKSSAMIARYRRVARSQADLDEGELTPLADALPELALAAPVQGTPTPKLER
jgi:integrase